MIRGKGSLARHWPGRQWLSDVRFWGLAEAPYFIKTRFIPIRPPSKTKRAQIHRIDRCRPCRMLTMAPAFQRQDAGYTPTGLSGGHLEQESQGFRIS
jgi:hypothetical protein